MVNLDINILPSCSLKKLVVVDDSNYDNNTINVNSMEITPPGFNKVNVTFVKDSINVYDSISLGISCEDYVMIPDGIYKFKYSTPGINEFIEKTFMRTELISCKYGKVLLSLHMEEECNDKTLFSKVRDIKMLIDGSISAANNCDVDLAYKLYNKADNLLDKIKKCNCHE